MITPDSHIRCDTCRAGYTPNEADGKIRCPNPACVAGEQGVGEYFQTEDYAPPAPLRYEDEPETFQEPATVRSWQRLRVMQGKATVGWAWRERR